MGSSASADQAPALEERGLAGSDFVAHEDSSVPSMSGPMRLNKKQARKSRRQGPRSAARAAAWIVRKEAQALLTAAERCALEDMPLSGGFIGHRKVRLAATEHDADPLQSGLVVHHSEGAAEVVDRAGRLVVYRAWQGVATEEANDLLTAAAAYLGQVGVKPTYSVSKRGAFAQYYFTLHKDNQPPRLSKYFCDHAEVAHELARRLAPVILLVSRIFRRVFPELHKYYASALDFALRNDASLDALFYPFASFALNMGEVICARHLDCTNLGPGLCCIIPFGQYDPSSDCRIGLAELGCEVEVAPGVPLWIPSAAFTHYNTALVTGGAWRGSAVFWTGGTMFQYHELGGRMVSELSVTERSEYQAARDSRIAAGIARFPERSPV
ncbi:uncharacterized protein B0H18DRAFT_521974 [Fomitopsis serialis]|uniref:uncharacterized protein n=1 Tax=Fomitopsis serialis TaxID=139415 RepID=UPI00200818D2|nr:uncharacterized protein B0H18DRAFT_521974 [Neoantrodia serialis]KAH9922190.1 hypothetical protein B0H18DRAFT_521974 [Neoantrodia serialis]